METHRITEPFPAIPAPPRHARPPERQGQGHGALRDACLIGMLALASAWTLAELATALGGF